MTLRKMLDTLSRSSAHAVSTLDNRNSSAVKKYLYIETDIEQKFKDALEKTTQSDQIIFLCGSSGDGKSEILTRYHEQYSSLMDFHFDATHSFTPDKDAIATLDDAFAGHKSSDKPMVVGINTGMMFNYSDSGADEHRDIKDSFRAYLGDKQATQNSCHYFLNFEDFPKYKLVRDKFLSPFIKDLLTKLTIADEKNPFFHAWLQEDNDQILYSNFRMLQQESVQDIIINTLLKLRLKNDVFLTARTILDFVHHILTGPNYLFDNLFACEKTDLFKALRQFDPCTVRSREIDLFLIQSSLTFDDPEFQSFQASVAEWVNPNDIAQKPGSWIRLFCLLQDIDIGNNFHKRFKENFRSELFEEYVRIWKLHSLYDGYSKDKKELKGFYKKGLTSALLGFANRFAPSLSQKNQIFLNDYNGYQVSAKAEIRESLKLVQLEDNRPTRLGYFNACLKLGDDDLVPLPISVNFLELIRKINRGYRPNRHDKNNIIILEEVIEDITSRIRNTDKLFIQKNNESWALINDVDEEEIRVER